MPAIVTSQFRVLNAENFKADVAADSVYVSIGKSDVWSLTTSDTTDTTPFTPNDHLDALGEARGQMIAMKRIASADISHVVPRHTWTSGRTYVAWDSDDASIFDKSFYIITSEFKVYKCIEAGTGASSIQPTQTLTDPTAESDGYKWKYMFTIGVSDAEKFLTNSYMPVKTVSLNFNNDAAAEAALTEADYAQYLNQKASRDSTTAQGIERIEVTAGGTSYSSDPTVTITGDGTGATATAVRTGTAVTSITINNKGTNYTFADITISGGGGSDATARAVIAPKAGHGVDPVSELGSFFISLNSKLDGNDGSDITVGNDFRQIMLIKDPKVYNATPLAGAVATATTLKAMKYLDTANTADVANYQIDEVITGATSGAKGFVVELDTTNGYIYYYQNSKTGYTAFTAGENITGSASSATHALASSGHVGNPEVDRGSGQVLFLENRDPINRTATQIEDIKVIIEF